MCRQYSNHKVVDVTLFAASESAYILNQLTPMSEFDDQYLLEKDAMIYYEQSSLGQWLLFYDHDVLDKQWQKASAMYRAREFPGIYEIQSSTKKPSPRASQDEMGVFLFRCSFSSDDKEEVLKCGQNIIKKMNYTSNYCHVAFKTNHQAIKGTRAMGVRKNYIYRLPVPPPNMYEM